MLEREIEKKIAAWAKRNGVYTRKFTSPSHRGVPDRIFIANGETLFLELKVEGKKPTKLQLKEIDKINQAGGCADWAVGFEEAVRKVIHHLMI